MGEGGARRSATEEGRVGRRNESESGRSRREDSLEQRDQEVNTEHDVGKDLILSHVTVSDGNTETEDLLKLELDGRLDLVDLVSEVLSVGDGSRELSGC